MVFGVLVSATCGLDALLDWVLGFCCDLLFVIVLDMFSFMFLVITLHYSFAGCGGEVGVVCVLYMVL